MADPRMKPPMPMRPMMSEPEPKLSPEQLEELQQQRRERQQRKAADMAPTTKTEMGKRYAKGGYVRSADGIAQRGKTRGRVM